MDSDTSTILPEAFGISNLPRSAESELFARSGKRLFTDSLAEVFQSCSVIPRLTWPH
jgi:hypothetical protein